MPWAMSCAVCIAKHRPHLRPSRHRGVPHSGPRQLPECGSESPVDPGLALAYHAPVLAEWLCDGSDPVALIMTGRVPRDRARRTHCCGKPSAARAGFLHDLRPPHDLSGDHRSSEEAPWYRHRNRNPAPVRWHFTPSTPTWSGAVATRQPSRFQALSSSRGSVGLAKVFLGEGDRANADADQCEPPVECCRLQSCRINAGSRGCRETCQLRKWTRHTA